MQVAADEAIDEKVYSNDGYEDKDHQNNRNYCAGVGRYAVRFSHTWNSSQSGIKCQGIPGAMKHAGQKNEKYPATGFADISAVHQPKPDYST